MPGASADVIAPYRWQPGQSGNPHGLRVNHQSLAKHVRRELGDGVELVEFYIRVMRGLPLPELTTHGTRARRQHLYPRVTERLAAAQWLSDRGWGKAVEIIHLADGDESTPEQRRALLNAMTDDERALMAALLARARARVDSAASPVVDAPESVNGHADSSAAPEP